MRNAARVGDPAEPPACQSLPLAAAVHVARVDQVAPPVPSSDRRWMAGLFDLHAGQVWNFAYRLTGSWDAADDALAEVFLVAWRRRRDMHLVQGSALPWLYVVTSNVCRGERRRWARLTAALPRLHTATHVRDHADEVADRHAATTQLAAVVKAVDALPPGQRDAVRLCHLAGLSYGDAAEALGISVPALHARLGRARTHLTHLFDLQR